MNIELLPNLTNVIRFPVEQVARPTYDLLAEIEPDIREVLATAEAFGLGACDPHLQDATDRETARYLAEQVLPVAGPDLNHVLDVLLAPAVAGAVAACRDAHRASLKAVEEQHQLHAAMVVGSSKVEGLKELAGERTTEAARLLVVASARCQQVRGMKRALDLARKGQPWTPYDRQADALAWLDGVERRRESAPY